MDSSRYGPYRKWELGLDYLEYLYNVELVDQNTRAEIHKALTTVPINSDREKEGFVMLEKVRPGGFVAWMTKQKLLGKE